MKSAQQGNWGVGLCVCKGGIPPQRKEGGEKGLCAVVSSTRERVSSLSKVVGNGGCSFFRRKEANQRR